MPTRVKFSRKGRGMLFKKLILLTHGFGFALGCMALVSLSSTPLLAQEDPSWRHLLFLPTPITTNPSTDPENPYSWPSFKLVLHEKAGDQLLPAAVDGHLLERLEAVFPAGDDGLIQKINGPEAGGWGLEIPGGSKLRSENILLKDDMTRDFGKCLAVLSEREVELVKSVLYNLDDTMNMLGEVRLSEETSTAIQTMQNQYAKDRCATAAGALPSYTIALIDRFMNRLLSGSDPSDSISDQDLIALTQIFKGLLFSNEGLWVRVSLERMQSKLATNLQKTAEAKQLDWLSKPFSGFVDFVVATRKVSGLSKEDYLTLANSCGVSDVSAIFSDFLVENCRQSQKLQLVDIAVGDSKGLVLLPGIQAESEFAAAVP